MFTLLESIWLGLLLFYFIYDFLLFFSILIIRISPIYTNQFPLSVIIAAKNEAENLTENLPAILNQNYLEFEVIVVNDKSEDDTENTLKKLAKEHQNLRYLNVDSFYISSKKNAISKGIKAAKYEHLVFTDADCKPLSKHWLENIQNYFSAQNPMVLGFSPYQKQQGFLNKLIQYETLQTAVNYYGFANLGMAYMGVGRNLAYTKKVYQKNNGFESHKHLLSGDDDLFVNQVSEKYRLGLCLHPDSFVESRPEMSFISWVEQKRRHITTAPHYQLKHKLLLGFQYLTKILFWFLAIPLSLFLEYKSGFTMNYFLVVLILMTLKSIIAYQVYRKFQTDNLSISSYIWELLLICIQFYIFTINIISPKKNW